MARTCLFKQVLRHKKIGKSWSQRVAPIGSSRAATAPWRGQTQPTVGVLHRGMCGTWKQYQPRKSRMTAPQKKPVPQWQAFPNGIKIAAKWLVSESQKCTCKHVLKFERWSDFWVKVKSRTWQARSWRWSWLASERAVVLLVDTSKVTQEQALQVWEWNIQKQQ